MAYGSDDLGVFVAVRDTALLEGSAYFELHPGELPEPYACWLAGSLFFADAAFDFFVTCFERANPEFDYFAFVCFERVHIDALLGELSTFTAELEPGCSREVVFSRYSSLINRNIWDNVATEELRPAVVGAADEMASFIQRSCARDRRLWVLGM